MCSSWSTVAELPNSLLLSQHMLRIHFAAEWSKWEYSALPESISI